MADRQRSSVRRWAQLALGAAIVMYGIVGFPTPQDTDPPEAAADTQTTLSSYCAPRPPPETGCVYRSHTVPVPHVHRVIRPNPPPPPFPWHLYEVPDWLQPTVYDDYSVYDPMTGITSPPPGSSTPGSSTPGSSTPGSSSGSTLCGGEVHGEACDRLDDLGIDRDLLDGPTYDMVPFADAKRLALAACAVNAPPCNQKAAREAWEDADQTFDRGVSRITQAETMCAAYDGPSGCSDEDEVIAWMCDTGYTANCGGEFEFDPYATMSSGESWTFNEQPILDRLNGGPCDGCYIPPGGHQYSPNLGDRTPLGPSCDNGLTVIAARIDSAAGDDGCRPRHCDFGRSANGWCAPPANSEPPVIYVVGEDVDEDDGQVSFQLKLSHRVRRTVTVQVGTVDGTANAGSDYTAVRRTATFAANRRTVTVPVSVADDTTHEPDEMFMLQLSSPSANTVLSVSPEASATIRDDDPAPVLVSISGNPTAEEGDSLVFTVSLDVTPTSAVSVSYRVDDPYYWGHPLHLYEGPLCGFQPTTDYVDPSDATLTWSPGDATSRRVSIQTCDDLLDEQDKTLTVELHTPSGAAIGTGSASGTITDNDDASAYPTVTDPTFFVNSPTVTEGGELEFVVTFLPVGRNWWGGVTMDFSGSATLSAAGTECAAVGDDAHINRRFTNSQNTYTQNKNSGAGWAGGATARLVLYTCDDTIPEALETITAALSTTPRQSSTAAAVGPDGVGTIIDNDPPEVYLAGPVTAREGTTLDFEVRLRAAAPADVTVTVSTTVDPAAVHPASPTGSRRDYVPKTDHQVTIPAGSLSQTVRVFTSGDTAAEYDETLLLRIDGVDSRVGGVVGSPDTAIGTIVDNDDPAVTLDGLGLVVIEGSSVQITANLDMIPTGTASVRFLTSGAVGGLDPCAAGDDFSLNTSGFVFDNATAASVTLTACDDTDHTHETVTVSLTTAGINGLQLGTPTTVVVSIIDTDVTTLSVAGPSAPVDEDIGGVANTADFTVSLNGAVAATVTVTASTWSGIADGDATGGVCGVGGADYAHVSAVVTFAPGELSKTFTVSTCADTDTEADETFTVSLSAATNAPIDPAAWTVTGTIADNDNDNDNDTVVCAITELYDPVTNTCVARTFFS